MSQNKEVNYLKELNKELVKELSRYDKLYALQGTKLSKQEQTIKLLNDLQIAIASEESDSDFYQACARLISGNLKMECTFILIPDSNIKDKFEILNYKDVQDLIKKKFSLHLSDLPEFDKYILINKESPKTNSIQKLQNLFNLSSLILYPVYYNGVIKLIIVSGRNLVNTVLAMDVDLDDVKIVEAVSVLLSSFIRKVELIRLNELDEIKTEFVSNISHEFRTPLTLVLGLLEEFKSKNHSLENEDAEKLSIIIKNANRLKELIDQLLDISKLETETEKLSISENNLNDLVSTIVRSYSTIAKKKNTTFKYSFSFIAEETWYDADKIEKIISNLLSNAFKYTPRKGEVNLSVQLKTEKDKIIGIFIVSDNGIGIPKDKQIKIFDRFYRINNANKQEEGTGVGLYLVKKLTELHKGSISLQSKLNKGSKFEIRIPLSKNAYNDVLFTGTNEIQNFKDQQNQIRNQIQKKDEKPILLVIEDNSELNHFIVSNLAATYNVIEAFDGKEGLSKAIQYIPDLIVTDIMMPEMDGNEMCKKIRANDMTAHIPIIMLTAKVDRDSKIKGLFDGAEDYITKPFDMQELQLKVKNQIESNRKLKEKYKKEFLSIPDDSKLLKPHNELIRNVIKLLKQRSTSLQRK